MTSLSDYFISAPLSALLTLSLGISLALLSDRIGKWIFKTEEPVHSALYFFAGLLAISWLIWLISLAGMVSVILLKVIFWSIILCGIGIAAANPAKFWSPFDRKLSVLKNLKSFELLTALTLLVAMVGYLLLSLTVPTDSDSLNYHLALPVEMLQKGSLWFNRDNLHYRLAGFGEMINVLGVANGCPQLGSVIQMIALGHTLNALTARLQIGPKLTIGAFVAGIPTLLFLLPNQKHQLTGILCTTVCFLFISNSAGLTLSRIRLLILVMLFASGIKYSFLISGIALIILFLLKRKDDVSLPKVALNFALLTLCVLGPQLVFRWLHFHDPFSPIFEGLFADPDPVVQRFYHYIKTFRESSMPYPANLTLTDSPGKVSTILGPGVLVLGFLPFLFRNAKAETVSIIFLIAAISLGSQLSSRFLMEPILWTIPPFAMAYSQVRNFRFFVWFSRLQLLCVLPFIALGLYSLGPSLFSDSRRTEVLLNSANGYSESVWLDQELPNNAKIATTSHARAFLNRPFFPWEYLVFTSTHKPEEMLLLRKKLVNYGIDYIVLPERGAESIQSEFAEGPPFVRKTFPLATRNPFNRKVYSVSIFRTDTTSRGTERAK
ncbi:DUF1420 family protein [Dyadobacter sp. CY347]|uniref:DUF1420 family protein n=1 Tax=Dyadobacter sp. CY347 TaxID=2909336 RepID=UPI001F1BE230|nr:DUF1420 family protein [Dyadobacter sp. CY347]MCF2489422.1 DUF1420 family protein [Dyadobacter sp. CY347]